MPRMVVVLLAVPALTVVFAGAVTGAARADERWRRPLPGGAVVGAFSYERATPYERGRRRGVDVAGAPGAPVAAACAGTVTHAGRVPGFGRGVTLRCGGLVATELGLSAATVRRDERVAAGAIIGRLARRGVLRLGARVAGDRLGYLDPLELVGRRRPTVAPPPAAGGRRRPAPAAGRVPAVAAHAPSPAPLPVPVLAGAGLLAAGLGGGGAARRRRGRRARAGIALAQR